MECVEAKPPKTMAVNSSKHLALPCSSTYVLHRDVGEVHDFLLEALSADLYKFYTNYLEATQITQLSYYMCLFICRREHNRLPFKCGSSTWRYFLKCRTKSTFFTTPPFLLKKSSIMSFVSSDILRFNVTYTS